VHHYISHGESQVSGYDADAAVLQRKIRRGNVKGMRIIALIRITLSLPCGEQKRHTRSMNHRAVALRIELADKGDDHLYPRVILLTVFLLTAICLFPYH
jgi:hypothetical protein